VDIKLSMVFQLIIPIGHYDDLLTKKINRVCGYAEIKIDVNTVSNLHLAYCLQIQDKWAELFIVPCAKSPKDFFIKANLDCANTVHYRREGRICKVKISTPLTVFEQHVRSSLDADDLVTFSASDITIFDREWLIPSKIPSQNVDIVPAASSTQNKKCKYEHTPFNINTFEAIAIARRTTSSEAFDNALIAAATRIDREEDDIIGELSSSAAPTSAGGQLSVQPGTPADTSSYLYPSPKLTMKK
jgi:hypothetical protein